MAKQLYIAEKPSVAREFASALQLKTKKQDGYLESEEAIVTWCVGHLVTMSYPDAYDPKYKRWAMETLPFIPSEFKYHVIDGVKKQFQIVSKLLNREDVETIYVCTDSGREGEYIYRLVEQLAGVKGKVRKRVWIDSQTQDEIIRGIKEAKDLSEYDNLCASAYLRAKEDYLMGINFSRLLTLKFGTQLTNYVKNGNKNVVISVGRVMTCVLGMVVNREREIREFVKTPFFRVISNISLAEQSFEGEFRAVEGSKYENSPLLYKENGFKQKEDAQAFIQDLLALNEDMKVEQVEKKKENKNAPLLYNLAELQNDCAKYFKISPSDTLKIVQELYEKKMVTYPRTDARVLSTAVAKEIGKNLSGLQALSEYKEVLSEISHLKSYQKLEKSRYVNDKQITDHYAIIPTGQGTNQVKQLPILSQNVYEIITRRFLAIFLPPAIYHKVNLTTSLMNEKFFSNFKVLSEEGYLKAMKYSFFEKKAEEDEAPNQDLKCDMAFLESLSKLKKGVSLPYESIVVKEGETTPPKRYNSGTLILAMENAGQFIEDEELRAQMKGSGIGTSATRAEILNKLVQNQYLSLNKKNQIITPAFLGEMIYEVVKNSIKPLLDPSLTASWEKGLTMVSEGSITEAEYMVKLNDFIVRRTSYVRDMGKQMHLDQSLKQVVNLYQK